MPMDAPANFLSKITYQIDLAAAAIAVIALVISFAVAKRQSRLEVENLRIQRDNDVIKWGNECIDVFSRLESIAYLDVTVQALIGEFYSQKIRYMAQLSAAIDKGRLYFPNVKSQDVGLHKDSAFRGYRRPILDALVDGDRSAEGYKFGDKNSMHAIRTEIFLARRTFVSELQKAVAPERRTTFLKNAGAAIDEVQT